MAIFFSWQKKKKGRKIAFFIKNYLLLKNILDDSEKNNS
jgi:hypothetical protein